MALDLPVAPQSITVTAGAAAVSTAINTALVPNFSTRFGATFVEYRIIGYRGRFRTGVQSTSTSAGLLAVYLDEKSGSTPTASSALEHVRLELNIGQITSDKIYEIDWVANDLTDLDWTPIGTSVNPVWVKYYTDSANFAAGGNSIVLATGAMRIQFRGLV